MSFMNGCVRHISVALLALTTVAAASGSAQVVDPNSTSRFFVTFRGVRIGSEVVTVTRAQGAFTISARGQVAPPIDTITTKFEMSYSLDWQPRRMTIEGALRNQTLNIATSFGLTTAISDVVQGQQRGSVQHEVSPRTIVLPLGYFAAYEVLAARLPSFEIGARFPVYIPPEGEVTGALNKVTPRRIVGPDGTTELREYDITLNRQGVPMSVLVSVDTRNRLAKVVFGEQGLIAIREDISSVMSREEHIRNPGDSDVFIPANDFSLAGTITLPEPAAARMPAVILIGGQGNQDRDETRYGISIFGQLAGRLAEAGYVVVRYDKRGIGQSGGRPEHAGLNEYAGDVLDIVTWLGRRKDIDTKRIFLLSHDDGSAVALTAAGLGGGKVRGVALLGASGVTGRETVLEQQQELLNRLRTPPSERDARIALQRRVLDAVVTGKGWESVPADLRRQADTVWFRSWLMFDPAVAIKKINQPLLIVHGSLDRETLPSNGDRLARMSTARKVPPAATSKTVVPGVNHLLLAAETGNPDEYDSLPAQTISPEVISAVIAWLNQNGK